MTQMDMIRRLDHLYLRAQATGNYYDKWLYWRWKEVVDRVFDGSREYDALGRGESE